MPGPGPGGPGARSPAQGKSSSRSTTTTNNNKNHNDNSYTMIVIILDINISSCSSSSSTTTTTATISCAAFGTASRKSERLKQAHVLNASAWGNKPGPRFLFSLVVLLFAHCLCLFVCWFVLFIKPGPRFCIAGF